MFVRAHRLWLPGVLFLSSAVAAEAQTTPIAFPTFEVTGGYQLLHVPDNTFPFGLNLDGAFNPSDILGLVGEIGWAMDSEDEDGVEVRAHVFNIGVGPRVNARLAGRVWPFAQVLVGAVHARTTLEVDGVEIDANDTRFMLQPGGGVNINAGDGWGVVAAADYRRVFLDEDEVGESGENDFRVFVGIRLLLD